ncbi:MAG TPA: cupin domain-containing protein [Alphaproteobacteria bacterium]|nr:cupin domain-containing protein [Alphaproteobacteria bacterium]
MLTGIAPSAPDEVFQDLLTLPGVRIERIVSTGQASPPGFWYDQGWAEWVLVVAGSAGVQFENEGEPRRLGAGDYLFIAAGRRHRVAWTDPSQPTVWLALHLGEQPSTS